MLARSLKMAFWVLYDHLGKFILINLLCAIPIGFSASLALTALLSEQWGLRLYAGFPLAALTLCLLVPAACAGLAHLCKVLLDTRDGAVADFFGGIRRYARPAAVLGLMYAVVFVCLSTSIWFYAVRMPESVAWLGYALSGLALWVLLFIGLTGIYVFPALVQKREGAREAVKLAGLLVLDNPLFSVGLAFQMLAATVLCLMVTPLMFFLHLAIMVVMASSAYEILSRKYALREIEALPPAEREKRRAELTDDGQDDYLNRGFRDFLFPWKG